MQEYILKRLMLLFPVLLGVSIVIFTTMRVLPGDIAVMKLGDQATTEDVQKLRDQLGLNKPLHEQYFIWISGAVRGDLGESLWTGKPVLEQIVDRVPISMELTILAACVSIITGITAGTIAAIRQDSIIDHSARLVSIAGLTMPGFWLGTLFLIVPSIWLHWAPPMRYVSFFTDPSANIQQFMFPAIALGAPMSAIVMRMTRSALLEVLRQDYIRTAWAKGLRERIIISRHALKNAFIPVITIIGQQIGTVLGGTVIMETIFSLPGVGRLTLDAISQRDYPQIQGNILFIATVFVVINLIVDMTYAWLDPRIRYA